MKFQIAFALLAIFGAAQAGKSSEVLTFGSGYNNMYEQGGDLAGETGDYGDNIGSTSAEIVREGTEQAFEATDDFTRKSQAYSDDAKFYQDLAEEKRHMAQEYRKRAQDLIARANEAYKNSQLHKRASNDKLAIAKEYERRAQEHDRISKEQDIYEQDLLRKESAEHREYVNNLRRANAAAANSAFYVGEAQAEYDVTTEYENAAKELYSKAEQYEKMALELRDKSKKEKEGARANEAKGKEEEARAADHENSFAEASKKVNQLRYYQLEFLLKGENERHLAEDARIRAKYLSLLSNFNKDQAEALFRFANVEHKDHESFKRRALETRRQEEMLAKSAAHILKGENYSGYNAIGKRDFPSSSYHAA